MTILPINPAANANPDALRAFLEQCRAAAARAGRPKLVSISLAVDALDPLAVLDSIFEPGEPHFYAERPDIGSALAGEPIGLRELPGGDWLARFMKVELGVIERQGRGFLPYGPARPGWPIRQQNNPETVRDVAGL